MGIQNKIYFFTIIDLDMIIANQITSELFFEIIGSS